MTKITKDKVLDKGDLMCVCDLVRLVWSGASPTCTKWFCDDMFKDGKVEPVRSNRDTKVMRYTISALSIDATEILSVSADKETDSHSGWYSWITKPYKSEYDPSTGRYRPAPGNVVDLSTEEAKELREPSQPSISGNRAADIQKFVRNYWEADPLEYPDNFIKTLLRETHPIASEAHESGGRKCKAVFAACSYVGFSTLHVCVDYIETRDPKCHTSTIRTLVEPPYPVVPLEYPYPGGVYSEATRKYTRVVISDLPEFPNYKR